MSGLICSTGGRQESSLCLRSTQALMRTGQEKH